MMKKNYQNKPRRKDSFAPHSSPQQAAGYSGKVRYEIRADMEPHAQAWGFLRRRIDGLTLIEVLVTIVILALVLYPTYEFLRQGALSWQIGENKTEVVQNARIGVDKMCDEIKHAREFYTVNPTQIRFWWKDLNDDYVADSNEILMFSWSGISGEDLYRQLDSELEPSPLANYVDGFELKYYDDAGMETVDLDSVRFITATLRVKKTAQGHDYISVMRKSMRPRNI